MDVVMLEENNRLDKNNLDIILFEEFLSWLHNGVNAEDDFNLLHAKCSYYSMDYQDDAHKSSCDADLERNKFNYSPSRILL